MDTQSEAALPVKPLNFSKKPKTKTGLKKFLPIVGIVVAVLLIPLFLFLLKNKTDQEPNLVAENDVNASLYYSFFLDNGQVYFGKIRSISETEIVATNIYYLQTAQNESLNPNDQTTEEPRFNLVKLGKEIHGPTDELFINRAKLLFYERLRKDSKIVESIEGAN